MHVRADYCNFEKELGKHGTAVTNTLNDASSGFGCVVLVALFCLWDQHWLQSLAITSTYIGGPRLPGCDGVGSQIWRA